MDQLVSLFADATLLVNLLGLLLTQFLLFGLGLSEAFLRSLDLILQFPQLLLGLTQGRVLLLQLNFADLNALLALLPFTVERRLFKFGELLTQGLEFFVFAR
ncbi:MAG: hypothetical protein HC857_11755 [Synechococcales cyanobacterium RU_4_20]|nr:hypothetical protein [Synechococcales cyanobacterium RU_4_20]